MKKNLLSILTILTLLLPLIIPSKVVASTNNVNIGITPPISSENTNDDITPYDVFPPSIIVNLRNYGTMNFSGEAQNSQLFLDKGFTGVSNIYIWIENFHPSSTLRMSVHRMEVIGTTIVATYDFEVGTGGGVFVNGLNSNKNYYISFSAPSNFAGYVEEN